MDLFNETEGHMFEVIKGVGYVNFTVEELYEAFIQRMMDEGLIGKALPPKRTPDSCAS